MIKKFVYEFFNSFSCTTESDAWIYLKNLFLKRINLSGKLKEKDLSLGNENPKKLTVMYRRKQQ